MKSLFNLLLLTVAFSLLVSSLDAVAQSTADIAGQRSSTRLIPPSKGNPTGGDIYAEPVISLSSGTLAMRSGQLPGVYSGTAGTTSGLGIGIKPGVYMTSFLILGIDARYEHQSMQEAFYANGTANEYTIGPTLTWETPYYGIRLMGTYVLAGEYDPSLAQYGVDMQFKDPNGYRVGAGVHIGAISLNLEYQDVTFSSTQVNSMGSLPPTSPKLDMKTETAGYLVSLSFPYDF